MDMVNNVHAYKCIEEKVPNWSVINPWHWRRLSRESSLSDKDISLETSFFISNTCIGIRTKDKHTKQQITKRGCQCTHNYPRLKLTRFDTDYVPYHIPKDNQIQNPNLTVEEFSPGTKCKLSSFEASNCNNKHWVCSVKNKNLIRNCEARFRKKPGICSSLWKKEREETWKQPVAC